MREEKEIIWGAVIAVCGIYLGVAAVVLGTYKLDTDLHDEVIAEAAAEGTLLRAKEISFSIAFGLVAGERQFTGKYIDRHLNEHTEAVAVLVLDQEGNQFVDSGSLAGSPAIERFAKEPRSAGQTQIDIERGLFLVRNDIEIEGDTQPVGTLVLVEDHSLIFGANRPAFELMLFVFLGGFLAIVVLSLTLARRPVRPPRDHS